jgi:hypothetical protein
VVLGRRELSAILLAIAAIVFYLILLSTTPSGAQTGGGTTVNANEGCQNPQQVQTFTGSNSQLTPSFNITGNTFQINLQAQPVQQGQFADIFIDSIDQSTGLVVPFGGIDVNPVEGQVNQTANVLEGPGNFSLRIQSTNTQYQITVFDCVGSQTTANPSNQGGVTASVNPSQRPQRERSIINIPNKPLPPSGGLPVVATVASFVLTGTALLALGIVIRRSSRR